jgi:hypothetical protein
MAAPLTDQDLQLAQICLNCPVSTAPGARHGTAYWAVKTRPGGLCLACPAYARVYGTPTRPPRSA